MYIFSSARTISLAVVLTTTTRHTSASATVVPTASVPAAAVSATAIFAPVRGPIIATGIISDGGAGSKCSPARYARADVRGCRGRFVLTVLARRTTPGLLRGVATAVLVFGVSSQGLVGGIGLTGILQAGDARGEDVVEVDEGLQDGLGQALEILAVGEVLAAARRAVSDGFESSPETEAERLLGLPFFAPGGGIAVLLGDLYGLGHGGEDNADGLKDVHFGKRAQSVTKRLQGVEHQSF
ncbi:hypothetical protein PG988_006712 [Apiospora saccharicola]